MSLQIYGQIKNRYPNDVWQEIIGNCDTRLRTKGGKYMLGTILAFIKTHTIATIITATVVVSIVVATPIIINQVQKPEQEIEIGQTQENIIDNTVEEDAEMPEENNIDRDTTVLEEEQKVETAKGENKNQGTTKPSSNTSTTEPTTNNNKTENQGTWITIIPSRLEIGAFQYNATTQKYRMVNSSGCGPEFAKSQAMSHPDVKFCIDYYNDIISSEQKQIDLIHSKYEGYRAEAQKDIDDKQKILDDYINSAKNNGIDLEKNYAKRTLLVYNASLQSAISRKSNLYAQEEVECLSSKEKILNAQAGLNAIRTRFQ